MSLENPLIKDVDMHLKTFATTLSKPQFANFKHTVKVQVMSENKNCFAKGL